MYLKHFTLYEMACSCCGQRNMEEAFMLRLDHAREISNIPYVINSGYRCIDWNEYVGGKPDSSHLFGWAADIRVITNYERFKILEGLLYVGFNRIGIAKTYIHVDADPKKPSDIIWLYDPELPF